MIFPISRVWKTKHPAAAGCFCIGEIELPHQCAGGAASAFSAGTPQLSLQLLIFNSE